ncbi:MAG TPA: neutral zinc metallopeptidase [Gemmatimonadaceae bacterium]
MRWQDLRRSTNVQDRRGMRAGLPVTGGLGLVVVLVIAALTGVNPLQLLGGGGGGPGEAPPADDPARQFVSAVLGSTEDVWGSLFNSSGQQYRQPSLVIFSGYTSTGCGTGQSATGPFYCPLDQTVYIDLSFYEALRDRLGAPGDFAQAYVIAHEVGHHVQNLLGTMDRTHQMRSRQGEAEANATSVRLELQADCYAGLWAHHAERERSILEQGDVEEALGAASAIGDDRLQRQSQGTVVPESFTHGTSEQRVRWFRRGLERGDPQSCDTFNTATL